MEFHLLAETYPMMPEAELRKLETRMRDKGFNRTFPIVRFQGKILDGRNRFVAATAAKVDPFFADFKGTEEEAAEFVETANEHRRHLTEAWLSARRAERMSRVIEARAGGESVRAIAEKEGVSKSQVERDLAKETSYMESAVPSPGTPEPEKPQKPAAVKGRDGRTYTASKPKKPAAPKVVYLCPRCSRIGQATCVPCRDKPGAVVDPRHAAGPVLPTAPPPAAPDQVPCPTCKGKGHITAKQAASAKFVPPTLEEVAAYCKERKNKVSPQKWIDHYTSNGWRVGKNPMKDWKAAVRTWEGSEFSSNGTGKKGEQFAGLREFLEEGDE